MNSPVSSEPENLEAWLESLRKGNPLVDEEAFQEALRNCRNDAEREFLQDFWNAARKADKAEDLEPDATNQENGC